MNHHDMWSSGLWHEFHAIPTSKVPGSIPAVSTQKTKFFILFRVWVFVVLSLFGFSNFHSTRLQLLCKDVINYFYLFILKNAISRRILKFETSLLAVSNKTLFLDWRASLLKLVIIQIITLNLFVFVKLHFCLEYFSNVSKKKHFIVNVSM